MSQRRKRRTFICVFGAVHRVIGNLGFFWTASGGTGVEKAGLSASASSLGPLFSFRLLTGACQAFGLLLYLVITLRPICPLAHAIPRAYALVLSRTLTRGPVSTAAFSVPYREQARKLIVSAKLACRNTKKPRDRSESRMCKSASKKKAEGGGGAPRSSFPFSQIADCPINLLG